MVVTITLTDPLATQLQRRADAERRSMEELALDILAEGLQMDVLSLTPEEVVAKIKATPPDPTNRRPARGSLAEALRNSPVDPNFAPAEWEREWQAIEAEMKAVSRANDVAEGRC